MLKVEGAFTLTEKSDFCDPLLVVPILVWQTVDFELGASFYHIPDALCLKFYQLNAHPSILLWQGLHLLCPPTVNSWGKPVKMKQHR